MCHRLLQRGQFECPSIAVIPRLEFHESLEITSDLRLLFRACTPTPSGHLDEFIWLVDCSEVLVRRAESSMKHESPREDEDDFEAYQVFADD